MAFNTPNETAHKPRGTVDPTTVSIRDLFAFFDKDLGFRSLDPGIMGLPDEIVKAHAVKDDVGMVHYEETTGEIDLNGSFMPERALFKGLRAMGLYIIRHRLIPVDDGSRLVVGNEVHQAMEYYDQIVDLGAKALGQCVTDARTYIINYNDVDGVNSV